MCTRGSGSARGGLKPPAIAVCLAIIALGAIGLASPDAMEKLTRPLESLYVAAVGRIIIGGALVLAAPASRAPKTLYVVGLGDVLAGLATPPVGWVLGSELDLALHDWVYAQGPPFRRMPGALAIAFGSGLMFLLRSKASAA